MYIPHVYPSISLSGFFPTSGLFQTPHPSASPRDSWYLSHALEGMVWACSSGPSGRFNQHPTILAVVICSCAILASTHWGVEARGDLINIWSLMLTVAASYALARSYGSLRMATFTVTFGTTVASAFTLVSDQLVASDAAGTTSSLALAAFDHAPCFSVGCQFVYGVLLGMQPLPVRMCGGSLMITISIWTANLVWMAHRTGDFAFLSVLLAGTALPLSIGFLVGVVSAPHSGRLHMYAALGVPPPSPPNAPPDPPPEKLEPERGQYASDGSAEGMLIAHQEASLNASQLYTGASPHTVYMLFNRWGAPDPVAAQEAVEEAPRGANEEMGLWAPARRSPQEQRSPSSEGSSSGSQQNQRKMHAVSATRVATLSAAVSQVRIDDREVQGSLAEERTDRAARTDLSAIPRRHPDCDSPSARSQEKE